MNFCHVLGPGECGLSYEDINEKLKMKSEKFGKIQFFTFHFHFFINNHSFTNFLITTFVPFENLQK